MKLADVLTIESLAQSQVLPTGSDISNDEAVANVAEAAQQEEGLIEKLEQNEQLGQGIDDAFTATDTITDVIEVVKSDEGGAVDQVTENLVNQTLESIANHLGLDVPEVTVESGSAGQRRAQLVESLEERKAGILDKIIAGMKALASNFVAFLQNLVRSNYMLKRLIDRAAKTVESLGDKKASEKVIDCPQISVIYGHMTLTGNEAVQKLHEGAEKMLKRCAEGVEEIKKLNFNFKEADSLVSNNMYMYSPGQWSAFSAGAPELANGRHFAKGGTDGAWEIKTSEHLKEVKAPVAKVEEMKQHLKICYDLQKKLADFDKSRTPVQNALSRLIQGMYELGSGAAGLIPAAARQSASQHYYRKVRSLINSMLSRFPMEVFRSIKAILAYVNASAAVYK